MIDVLTVGEAAAICKMSPRLVAKLIDSGKLKGYRIPGGTHRRVILSNLIAFMREHGMGELVPSPADADGDS